MGARLVINIYDDVTVAPLVINIFDDVTEALPTLPAKTFLFLASLIMSLKMSLNFKIASLPPANIPPPTRRSYGDNEDC